MAGKLVFYTPEMLQKNIQGPQFPDEITIPRSSMDLYVKESKQYSPFLNTLNELSNRPKEIVLRREDFMGGDNRFWAVMLDLLFPWELPRHSRPSHEPFIFTQEGYYHNPIRAITDAEIKEVFDYLNIGQAKDMPQLLLKFVYDRPSAPKMPPNARKVLSPTEISRAQTLQRQQAAQSQRNTTYNNWNNVNLTQDFENEDNNEKEQFLNRNNNGNENYNNEYYNENNNTNFKNEEEAKAYSKLTLANFMKYKPKKGGKRKTRKLKSKMKRKTAKWTR